MSQESIGHTELLLITDGKCVKHDTRPWDTIIVGGGSAGAIVAGILAQRDPSERILLIEAGASDMHPLVKVPLGLVAMMGNASFDWMHQSSPSSSQGGAVTKIPRGKRLGGSGSINSMLYVRGRASDYDRWAQEGATGWGWDQVLPVFKRMEGQQEALDQELHGLDGPMQVEAQASPHPLCQTLIDAGGAHQIPHNPDFNGTSQEGLGLYHCNMNKGQRWTGVDAYLRPAMNNSQLAPGLSRSLRKYGLWQVPGQARNVSDRDRKSVV